MSKKRPGIESQSVESQMVIFDFEGEGDWNRACCHSNKNLLGALKLLVSNVLRL